MLKHKLMTAIGGLALLAATQAFGQASLMRADIPFEFRVGNEVLPAGQYDFRFDPAFHRLAVLQRGGKSAVVAWAHNSTRNMAPGDSRIVFLKYGNTLFLRQVWDGPDYGHELAACKAERRLAKASAPRELAAVRASSK